MEDFRIRVLLIDDSPKNLGTMNGNGLVFPDVDFLTLPAGDSPSPSKLFDLRWLKSTLEIAEYRHLLRTRRRATWKPLGIVADYNFSDCRKRISESHSEADHDELAPYRFDAITDHMRKSLKDSYQSFIRNVDGATITSMPDSRRDSNNEGLLGAGLLVLDLQNRPVSVISITRHTQENLASHPLGLFEWHLEGNTSGQLKAVGNAAPRWTDLLPILTERLRHKLSAAISQRTCRISLAMLTELCNCDNAEKLDRLKIQFESDGEVTTILARALFYDVATECLIDEIAKWAKSLFLANEWEIIKSAELAVDRLWQARFERAAQIVKREYLYLYGCEPETTKFSESAIKNAQEWERDLGASNNKLPESCAVDFRNKGFFGAGCDNDEARRLCVLFTIVKLLHERHKLRQLNPRSTQAGVTAEDAYFALAPLPKGVIAPGAKKRDRSKRWEGLSVFVDKLPSLDSSLKPQRGSVDCILDGGKAISSFERFLMRCYALTLDATDQWWKSDTQARKILSMDDE